MRTTGGVSRRLLTPVGSMGVEIAQRQMGIVAVGPQRIQHTAQLPQAGALEGMVQVGGEDDQRALSANLQPGRQRYAPKSAAGGQDRDWHRRRQEND